MESNEPQPRVSHLAPPYAPETQDVLDTMMPTREGIEPLRLFRTFARDLPLSRAITGIGRFMLSGRDRGGAAFDLRTRELVIDRVTARCHCEYEWGVHVTAYAAKAGFDDEQIHSIVYGRAEDPCWTSRDGAVIAMVDVLHDTSTLGDAEYAALREHFDELQIGELLILTGWYHAISYFANGLRTEREPWAARFPARETAGA
jgi:alkylhydroperoxidase family enzyme